MRDRFDAFHVMTKPAGSACNLNCKYCFYLEKEQLYPGPSVRRMTDEILESYIRQYIEAQKVPDVNFAWQGGEPTILGLEYFRKIVKLQERYADGKQITNALQTNGTLLDDEWGQFLKENAFLVGLSIDGPRELHDRYRVDRGGRPTFDRVLRGLELLKKHGVEFNTLTCVQRHNARKPLEVYRFLKEVGSGYMQFIPIVERATATPGSDGLTLVAPDSTVGATVTDWSVEPLQYGRFLTAIFDEWVRHDVGRYYVQLFDVALGAWLGMDPGLCVFSESCGTGLVLEHNGDVYSCDHYVYPENRLGNLAEEPLGDLVRGERQRAFGAAKRDRLPKQCLACEVRFACNGECPKHRFVKTADGEAGLNYLCAGYKHFFTSAGPYLQFMADQLRNERAPANIMALLRAQELGEKGANQDRPNAPCGCGSGRKRKKCCGAPRRHTACDDESTTEGNEEKQLCLIASGHKA